MNPTAIERPEPREPTRSAPSTTEALLVAADHGAADPVLSQLATIDGAGDHQTLCRAVRIATLIALDIALIALALLGILDVLAKDHVTPAEGVLAWISVVALPFLLITLVVLVVKAPRRRRTSP